MLLNPEVTRACFQPLLAMATAWPMVALFSANVEVRATAPGVVLNTSPSRNAANKMVMMDSDRVFCRMVMRLGCLRFGCHSKVNYLEIATWVNDPYSRYFSMLKDLA